MVTRIERPRSRPCVALLGVSFLVAFIVLLGIGDGAPDVLLVRHSEDDSYDLTYNGEENFYQVNFEMTREHQLFWMDLRLGTGDNLLDDSWPHSIALDLQVKMLSTQIDGDTTDNAIVDSYEVSTVQHCVEDSEFCNYFFLFKRDFVSHDAFSVLVRFADPVEYLDNVEAGTDHTEPLYEVDSRVTSINPDFTRFEFAFKYIWLITTLFVMFCPCGLGFMSALKRQRRDTGVAKKTFHQKWTTVLLWALVWFDEPFLAATVYTDWSKVFSAVFILSASIFVFLILLFWLCFLSDLRFMIQQPDGSSAPVRRGICYWIPKIILTLAIGTTVLGGYMYYRFENTLSFEYTGVADEKKAAEALAVLLGLMLSVYLLWTIVLGLRSCGSLRRVSPSYILLYCITLLACLVAIIGVFVAAYYPYSTSGTAFVGIHGLLNLYIWTLAISFSPVRSRSTGDPHALGMGDKPVSIRSGTSAVTGTNQRENSNGQGNGWEDPADSDFKAVEL